MAEEGQTQTGPFDQADSYRSLALQVENRLFWVPRDTLASYSPVFKAMLYGEFAESHKDTIELPGKKAIDVEEMLLCLIPTPIVKKVDLSNMEIVLPLADEYQIDDLRDRATAVLVLMTERWDNEDIRLLNILRIGSKHRLKEALPPIMKKCLINFTVTDDLKPIFKDLRSEVIAGLLQYRMMMPYKLQCRYWSDRYDVICLRHNSCGHLRCIYCLKFRCAKCFEIGVIPNESCVPYKIQFADEVVQELLDRM